jgi:hypothetical protein
MEVALTRQEQKIVFFLEEFIKEILVQNEELKN